jgi:hypothetical protein
MLQFLKMKYVGTFYYIKEVLVIQQIIGSTKNENCIEKFNKRILSMKQDL